MELAQLVWLRLRLAFASAQGFFRGSRLRVVVLCGAAIVFWMLMFAMFFDAFLFVRNFDALPEAVKLANKIAESGDIVLLSPACASYDMFENYEQRGKEFVKMVKSLK